MGYSPWGRQESDSTEHACTLLTSVLFGWYEKAVTFCHSAFYMVILLTGDLEMALPCTF